jgi:hypothetical protein
MKREPCGTAICETFEDVDSNSGEMALLFVLFLLSRFESEAEWLCFLTLWALLMAQGMRDRLSVWLF